MDHDDIQPEDYIEVTILGRKWWLLFITEELMEEIRLDESSPALGLMSHSRHTMYIRKGLPRHVALYTTLHEICHAAMVLTDGIATDGDNTNRAIPEENCASLVGAAMACLWESGDFNRVVALVEKHSHTEPGFWE